MYDVLHSIVGHVWVTGSGAPGDQSYYLYACLALVLVLTIFFVDAFRSLFRNFVRNH